MHFVQQKSLEQSAYIMFKYFYIKTCAHCLHSNESRKCKKDKTIKFPVFSDCGRFAHIINMTVCISAVEQVAYKE
jgi:hypothetical protein